MSRAATSVSTPAASSARDAALVGELMRHPLGGGESTVVDRLERAVRTYEVEFRRYLNGQGQRPPLELGAVLATAFVELTARSDNGRALAFRIDALAARFHVARRLLTQRCERPDRPLASHPSPAS